MKAGSSKVVIKIKEEEGSVDLEDVGNVGKAKIGTKLLIEKET